MNEKWKERGVLDVASLDEDARPNSRCFNPGSRTNKLPLFTTIEIQHILFEFVGKTGTTKLGVECGVAQKGPEAPFTDYTHVDSGLRCFLNIEKWLE